MTHVEKKPKAYKGMVHWYVSDWRSRRIELFKLERLAVARAKEIEDGQIVCVGWFPRGANPKEAISKTATIIDHR